MQRAHRASRPVQRVVRALTGAAVLPVVLVAAGCSSDAEPKADAKQSAGSGGSSAKPSPSVAPAAYEELPEACDALGKKTLGKLVPKGLKTEKAGRTDDAGTRGSCTWNSLDDNGVKGSQYRWLSVSLLRFDSSQVRGTGEEQAKEQYEALIADAKKTADAKKVADKPVEGVGDEATLVTYDLKKKEGLFKQQTVVALVENVVVTLDYNGAGLAGEDAPSVKTLGERAADAAEEAVAKVAAANGDDASGSSASPSASASASASAARS
ncbi:DUF3558 domain-containing protein [Streptomyces sp. MJP52]|uniref:DUF3558 domain-containing protein n=1 Tax=Streptomyces sp. MJP52 TaxID=2940555 RepID=UPI0024747950|nr:DUF3558 domain-containing protein [Streptomyces sp. MJP52]MDH6225684.1 hypothetical protein [Streptomyces sp. MJP52]